MATTGPAARSRFRPFAGTQYQIAIDGFRWSDQTVHFDQGTYRLSIDFEERTTPLGNDLFQDRIDLGSVTNATITGSNLGYVDDFARFNRSGWWSWTAPSDGFLTIVPDEESIEKDVQIMAYTGAEPTALQFVARGDYLTNQLVQPVTAGTEYHLAIGNSTVFTLPIDFSVLLSFSPGGFNDDFADRIDLGSVTEESVVGSNIGFTSEQGDPGQSGDVNSAWWTWTAPAAGTLYLESESDDFYFTAATGSDVTNLTVLQQLPVRGSSAPPLISRSVLPGQQVQIMVDGKGNHTGTFALIWRFSQTTTSSQIALTWDPPQKFKPKDICGKTIPVSRASLRRILSCSRPGGSGLRQLMGHSM